MRFKGFTQFIHRFFSFQSSTFYLDRNKDSSIICGDIESLYCCLIPRKIEFSVTKIFQSVREIILEPKLIIVHVSLLRSENK